MKHLIDRPSEPVMKFFTPELFGRFNSPDDDEADRADEEWERAIRAYREHLTDIQEGMSSQVKRLAKLDLHDAELLALDLPSGPHPFDHFEPFPFQVGVGIMSLRQDDRIISLFYFLWDHITRYESGKSWAFSKEKPHWLFDELDVDVRPFLFVHRILFSDGVVMRVPFLSAYAHSVTLKAPDEGRASKQSA